MDTTETTMDKGMKVYEIGYLLLPTIAEELLAAEVETIKALIVKHEGVFITEDFPKLRPLAYTMKKSSTGQSLKFDNAYFGWIKFEVNANALPLITKELDRNPNILRSMIINTVRENTMYTQRTVFRPGEVGEVAEGGEVKLEEAKEINEEEIDKTIENLVVE